MSITNFLAQRIQQGDTEALPYLWEQVKGAALTVVKKYGGAPSIDSDDLHQQAYFALLEAVKAYDAVRGDFKPLFCFYVRQACGRALNLHKRHVEELCILDQPVGEDGDATLCDLLEDETLVPAQDQMELDELSGALRAALEELPERWRTVLIEHDVRGVPFKIIARRLGCSQQNAQRLRACAIRRLKTNNNLARLYRAS